MKIIIIYQIKFSNYKLNILMSKYSIILPTYNERENLPVIVYLIFEMA